MSYAEHGPRIFLAGRPKTGIPLSYGDYVLPRKRLEGRLKLFDSCSDIRAWSPNSLENSRYFRELSEHDTSVGKIIPFRVVLDNIIQLNSQVQNELQSTKKELQKYRNLKLTCEQEKQLQNLNDNQKIKESLQRYNYSMGPFLKDVLFNNSKSVPTIHSNSYISIHIPSEKPFQNNKICESTLPKQISNLYAYSSSSLDVDQSTNNYSLIPSSKSTFKTLLNGDYSEKSPSWIEFNDVAIQVNAEYCDVGIQFDGRASPESPFRNKSSDEENIILVTDKSSVQSSNYEEQSSGCDASSSNSSQYVGILSEFDSDTGTESDFGTHSINHKGIIIQKDSEIIVLKNELCVRDVELEELQDTNKNLEISLKEKEKCVNTLQENLQILHDKFIQLDHQRICEVEELKKRLYSSKYLIGELKQDLSTKCESCFLQAQEIEKLRSCVTDITTLQLENSTLSKKLQEMEQLSEKAENCNLALEQLRHVLQEKEDLKKQKSEQSCMLIEQEEEIKRLLVLIKETSVTYDEQVKIKSMLESVETELQAKNLMVSQYEKQLLSMQQDICDFFTNLKHMLNNIDEFNDSCEDVCNCAKCDLDISEEANIVLCNVNAMMTRFQSYKHERENFLQQLEDLKDYINNDKQVYLNQNLRSLPSRESYYEPELKSRNTSDENNIIISNVKQKKNNISKVDFEDISNSMHSENSLNNYICKFNTSNSVDRIEKEIIEYVTHFLIKMHYHMKNLQLYMDTERPLMIKQIYNLYEVLKGVESIISTSEDVTLKKQRMSELYNQHREENQKCKTYIKDFPTDISEIHLKINEFIEAILFQLLNEIICTQNKNLHDNQINQLLETYLKLCIDRLNMALKGAGDYSAKIVEEIQKQQKELQMKDSEVIELKKEIAQHLAWKGEGDCLVHEEYKKRAAVEEELSNIRIDLNKKDAFVKNLEEQLQIVQNELSNYNKDCNDLRKENKNLHNAKNILLKEYQKHKEELQVNQTEINNLSQQLHDLVNIKALKIIMENKIKEMEKELVNMQSENTELKTKIQHANEIISKKDKNIINLKDNITENENILSYKVADYKTVLEEQECEIFKLKGENDTLNEKLKDTENKFTEMNETILHLTEQNDKINVIYLLQEDLAKFDKNEKKLKIELNNLKIQLANNQNNNKKLDTNLEMYQRENENLQKSVEYWKNEISELSIKLRNEIIDNELKNKLQNLSNKICDRLSNLKEERDLDKNQSNENIYHNEKEQPPVECTHTNFEKDQLLNSTIAEREIIKNDSITFEQVYSSTKEMQYEFTHLKPDIEKNQHEIEKLLQETEIRDVEIEHLKQTISHLAQENADLRDILKCQIEEYQDKLTLMKKNYNSSLNALCERHKESIVILQQRFEDTIQDERTFDSENWLQSLNVNDLSNLYERISMIINSKSNLIHQNDENQYLCGVDDGKDFYKQLNETENNMPDKEKNMFTAEERNRSNFQQWAFPTSVQVRKYSVFQKYDYKSCLNQNFRCFNDERKTLEVDNKCEKEKQVVNDNKFDHQRWNFISQCSTHHRLSNTYDYSRSIHAD